MTYRTLFPAILLTCLSLCGQAKADIVLFSQGVDETANSWISFQGTEQEMDNISIAESSAWTTVGWYGSYNSGVVADDFIVRLSADLAGTPGVDPINEENVGANVTRTSTGLTSTRGNEIFEYSAAATNFNGIATGDYHFSIINGVGSNWLWQGNGAGPGGHYRSIDGDVWNPHVTPTDFAFSISSAGSVPEPGSAAVLLACIVPAILRRQRKE